MSKIYKIMLWLNSGCNARCGTRDIWREKIGKYLSIETIRELAPQWKSLRVNTVVICGEPLLHPDLRHILCIIHQHAIRIEMLTNGFLLARHAEQVVEYCEVLRVNLDRPELIHNHMRGQNHAFDRLKKGITEVRVWPKLPD
ncbi:radical SAM protein [Gammaproteobacteria bacterium]|nr:radical SAM protein [Gammaproteobacteria bacterium]